MAPTQHPSSKSTSSTTRATKSRSKLKALKAGRPPLLSTVKAKPIAKSSTTTATTTTTAAPAPASAFNPRRTSLSSKHTRALIRTHHVLQKRLARARADNDVEQIQELEAQLAASGGLETYQLASTVGQSAERGGDSSRVLVEWLKSEIEARKKGSLSRSSKTRASPTTGQPLQPLHVLEIGALSTTNALNIPDITRVRRIDLRSSGPGIEEADFMSFPLPDSADGSGEWEGRRGYDVISLSLVLNYVPDAQGRGEMLRRTTKFFPIAKDDGGDDGGEEENKSQQSRRLLLPCLFLVLPAPTVHNSRYLTEGHLTDILSSLGYSHLETKTTRKLHYSLWQYDPDRQKEWIARGGRTVFRKKEIDPGGGRNNFCIVLD
ncbi:hypothetical protein KCU88_g3183, partial [Aureobasidium melanogenum]